MTAIVGLHSPWYSLQGSDRRVVRVDDRTPHDDQSNKTLAVVTPSEVIIASYSGPAYIGETCTDQRLAEYVCASRFKRQFATFQGDTSFRNGGEAIKRISDGLASESEEIRRRLNGLHLSIFGHKERRRGKSDYGFVVPYYVHMSVTEGAVRLERSPKLFWPNRTVLHAERSYLDEETIRQATVEADRIHQMGQPPFTAEDLYQKWKAHSELVYGLLKKAAERAPEFVGRDVMFVSNFLPIFPGGIGHVLSAHYIEAKHDRCDAYAPWIITPGGVGAPMRLSGHLNDLTFYYELNGRHWPIKFFRRALDSKEGNIKRIFMQAQRRPPPPI